MDNNSSNQSPVNIDPNMLAPQSTPPLTQVNSTAPGVIDITPGVAQPADTSSMPPASPVIDITPPGSAPVAPAQAMSGSSLADMVSTSTPVEPAPMTPLTPLTPPLTPTPPVAADTSLPPVVAQPEPTAAPVSPVTPAASPLQEDPNQVSTIA